MDALRQSIPGKDVCEEMMTDCCCVTFDSREGFRPPGKSVHHDQDIAVSFGSGRGIRSHEIHGQRSKGAGRVDRLKERSLR